MKDLYEFDFVFLQHGVVQDDLSGWLNKYQKNVRIFVTSARPSSASPSSPAPTTTPNAR